MPVLQVKENTVYALHWNNTTINILFLFADACLNKITELLDLEMISYKAENTPSIDFILLKKDNAFLLKRNNPNEEYVCATIDDLLMQAINHISWCFLERSSQLILHGGAIVVGNEAILFSGLPHSGKSSLATHAWLANYLVVGDDILACNPENHTISAFPRPLRPRLSSLNIPQNIMHHAGNANVIAGQFSYDIGLFIGRRSPNIVAYDQKIKIKSLYYIERDVATSVKPLHRQQALTIALTQTYPNSSCLKIASIVNDLSSKNAIKHLTIGHNEHQQALEIICE